MNQKRDVLLLSAVLSVLASSGCRNAINPPGDFIFQSHELASLAPLQSQRAIECRPPPNPIYPGMSICILWHNGENRRVALTYVAKGLPALITSKFNPNPTAGIRPNATKQTLTLDPNLAPGTYEECVYVHSTFGDSRCTKLSVPLEVRLPKTPAEKMYAGAWEFIGTSTAANGTTCINKTRTWKGQCACVWAVRTIAVNVGITLPGDSDRDTRLSVAYLHEDLEQAGWPSITQSETQAGDLVFEGNYGHVGVCLNRGCGLVISNSSTPATFTWESTPIFSGVHKDPHFYHIPENTPRSTTRTTLRSRVTFPGASVEPPSRPLTTTEAQVVQLTAGTDRCPTSPVTVTAVAVVRDYALTAWTCGSMAGEIIARRSGTKWSIVLNSGGVLTDLTVAGVPAAISLQLIRRLQPPPQGVL